MKELQEILKKIAQFGDSEKAILATVVALEGSGYRRPGARMLIDENGYSIGTISGGCLEADVLERAKKVLETGEPVVITYDTTADENSVFGLGMGCRGVIHILLESITKESGFCRFADAHLQMRKPFVVATLIKATEPNFKTGARILYGENGIDASTFTGELDETLTNSVNRAFTTRKSTQESFAFGEMFIEYVAPPVSLLLFGAGFDALPLADFAGNIGWAVTVIDHRAAWANRERFPNADEIIVSRPENLDEKLFGDENSVAVLMTHNYDRDKELLPLLLKSKAVYVGALGPKKRAERLLDEIGETFSEEQLKRFYAPIGLDIGAETPDEIALSIVAEIRGVLANRSGGFLRKRQGSIYGRH